MPDDKTSKEEAKIKLVKSIFINSNKNINTSELLSLLSLVFKENFNSDEIIQNFEVNFLREKNYAVTTLQSLIQVIENHEHNDQKKNDLSIQIIKKILTDINNKIISIKNAQDSEEKIIDIINETVKNNTDIKNVLSKEKQKEIITKRKEKKYTISPTNGIQLLNNNPYAFFVTKVLNLSPVNEWTYGVNQKLYGIIIHKIMQKFHEKYDDEKIISLNEKADKDKLEELFIKTSKEIFKENDINDNIFINQKINEIKNIAINIEIEAYKNKYKVLVEKEFATTIDNVRICAKADRIEIDNFNKKIYIFDFKTSLNEEKKNKEINGSEVQLLIIAMIILKQTCYSYKIEKMKYIDLSGKQDAKNIEIDVNYINNVENNIKQQIETYFHNGQPILENMIYIKPESNHKYERDIAVMKFHRDTFIDI